MECLQTLNLPQTSNGDTASQCIMLVKTRNWPFLLGWKGFKKGYCWYTKHRNAEIVLCFLTDIIEPVTLECVGSSGLISHPHIISHFSFKLPLIHCSAQLCLLIQILMNFNCIQLYLLMMDTILFFFWCHPMPFLSIILLNSCWYTKVLIMTMIVVMQEPSESVLHSEVNCPPSSFPLLNCGLFSF